MVDDAKVEALVGLLGEALGSLEGLEKLTKAAGLDWETEKAKAALERGAAEASVELWMVAMGGELDQFIARWLPRVGCGMVVGALEVAKLEVHLKSSRAVHGVVADGS